MLAIIGAGGRFTGSNPSYTSFELNHHIRVSQARFLIAEPPMLPTTLQSAKDCEIPESRVFTFETKDQAAVSGQKSWTDLLQHGEADWLTFDKPGQAKSTISTLAFTSGTTGFPKAAMIPHLYAISQLKALENQRPPYEVSRLICIPAFHAFAVPLLTGCAIRNQQTAYVMRRFELGSYLRSIRRFKITEIAMVPTMLIAVLNSSLTQKEDLESLRSVWVGGSPLRSSTQKDFQALLHPDALVTQVWGMTETGWTTLLFWPESDDTGSVGRLLPNMSSKLIAEDGSVITEDYREGELFVKGTSIMNGYFNDPSATAATIDEDGWLRTGDVAYCVKGKWYIVDRKKDLIKFHGWQIAPAELEAVLLTHPQIVNAAVIGIPLKDGTGEVPQAFVVLKPRPMDGSYASHGELEEQTTTEEEVKNYLSSRLAKFKALHGVTFVDDIPRTPSGKLQKFKLKEMYLDLPKATNRKISTLETIADRNAAMSNGTTDPITIGTPKSRLKRSREAQYDGDGEPPIRNDESSKKRVKILTDGEAKRASAKAERGNGDGNTRLSNGHATHVKEDPIGKSKIVAEDRRAVENGNGTSTDGIS